MLLSGWRNRTLWRRVISVGHQDACSYFESLTIPAWFPRMYHYSSVPLICLISLVSLAGRRPWYMYKLTTSCHMSHEYIDVYCIIMSFFILIDYVFAIVCANIKSCNSTTKNPLGIALKKSCQFSCDFLASTKEWMRRGLEALRSLFAHVELCLYQWPCPPMLLLLKRHTDIQTNSWYLWAKQKPGFFSSQAIVTCFFLNHIKKLYTSGTLLIVQKSFVLSGLRIIYYKLSCYRVGYMFPKRQVLKWPSVV